MNESKQEWKGTPERIWENHEELFHYTNRIGLDGILATQTLYETHYAHLNDYEETLIFNSVLKNLLIPKAKQVIEKWANEGKLSKDAIDGEGGVWKAACIEVDTLVTIIYKALIKNGENSIATPFICSFCSHAGDSIRSRDGLLSQWRGYSKEGGYAIIFDAKRLHGLMDLEVAKRSYFPFGCGDVVYQGEEERLQTELGDQVKILSDFLMEMLTARALNFRKEDYPIPSIEVLTAQATCMSICKHSGFKEEKEFRIYAFRPNDKTVRDAIASGKKPDKDRAEVKRTKKGKKYIELFKNLKTELPIKRIIVGPQNNKEKIADGLRKDPRFSKINIEISSIPFAEQNWEEDD
jgi:hypothetical protein